MLFPAGPRWHREQHCGPPSYIGAIIIKKLLTTPGPANQRNSDYLTGGFVVPLTSPHCDGDCQSDSSVISPDISRHKRNLGVRQLDDYRPYWFARDLRGSRGSKGAKVSEMSAGARVDISYISSGLPACQSHLLSLGRQIERHQDVVIKNHCQLLFNSA